MAIIEASGLTKTYRSKSGPVHALAGLDLSVPQGTVTALLGPNGAGKTTTVKVLTTLVKPDSGTATIAGVDVVARPPGHPSVHRGLRAVRRRRREPDRLREPRDDRAALPPRREGLAGTGARAHRRVRPGRGRGPSGQGLLRRHAAADRPRRGARDEPERAVPRRTDDGARPPEPTGAVGDHRAPRGRRGHGAADHAVPRRGRPSRRRHRGHRRRARSSPRAPPTSSRRRSAGTGSS